MTTSDPLGPTGNTSGPCRYCGVAHDPMDACGMEDMRNEIERLRFNPRTDFLCAKCAGGIYERDAVIVDGDKHYHAICYVTRRAELAESEIYRLRAELDRARRTIRLAASMSRSMRGERSDCRPDERDMM